MEELKRFKKDHSVDGWPVRDNENQRILYTDDLVIILNNFDKLQKSINKIKADAVRAEVENLHNLYPHLDGPHLGILTHRANKLERGEL